MKDWMTYATDERLMIDLRGGSRSAGEIFAIEVGPAVLLWALILAFPARYAIRRWRRRQDAAAWR
jgi:hypothetical protein